MNGPDMKSCYWQAYIAITSAYLDDIAIVCFVINLKMSSKYTTFNLQGMSLSFVIMSSITLVPAKTKFEKAP